MNRRFSSALFLAVSVSVIAAACSDEETVQPIVAPAGGSTSGGSPSAGSGGNVAIAGAGGTSAVSGGSGGQGGASAGNGGAVSGGSAGSGGVGLCSSPDVGGPSITWTKGPDLPLPRDHHMTFILESCQATYLYVAGGFKQATGAVLLDISRSPIAADGSLGAWETVKPLPKAIAGAGVTLIDGYVVIAGGYGASGTWIAKIGDDGSLGAFTAGPSLPAVRFHTSAVTIDHAVYVTGGIDGINTSDDVMRATVNADGTLSPWTRIAALPYTLSHHTSVGLNHTLYILGGQTGNVNISAGTTHNEVYSAAIQADGSLGAWTKLTALPFAPETHASVAHDDFLYVVAGISDLDGTEANGIISNKVLRAPINADATIGDWLDDAPSALPHAKSHMHQTPVWNGHIYGVAGLYQIEPMMDTAEVDVGAFGN